MVSKASSTMLEKATDDDVAGFQYYTIRNLDNKLSIQSAVQAVEHQRGSFRQQTETSRCHVLSGIFPDGNFGKYHPREVKVSHSEYVKSRR